MDKLPVYEMVIDENPSSDIEVAAIAFVDKPAIEKNFMAFANLKLDFKLDPERKIISGPAMVPDTLIYRRDQNGEYNVFFSKDTVEAISLKFFKKDYQKNINLFHDPNLSVQGVTVFESFISDQSRGIQPMAGYEDLPDGTWFISAKIENDAVWQAIKEGKVKGFSVEGYFASIKKDKPVEDKVFELLSATEKENKHFQVLNDTLMAKAKDALKNLLSKFKKEHFDAPPPPPPPPVVKMSDYQTKDGTTVSVDKLEPGGKCTVNGQPCPPGDYELADGTKVTVGDGGVISAVTPPMAMQQPITMADVEAAITKALTAFKPAADPATAQLQQTLADQKKNIEKQTETIKQLFAIVEEIADTTIEAPAPGSRQNFVKKFQDDRDDKIKTLSERLSNLKKAQ